MFIKLSAIIASCGIFLALFPIDSGGTSCIPSNNDELPMVYGYFKNEGGNVKGLEARTDGFYLAEKKLKIISGSMHYFRIHPDLWRDRLKKLRAAGANTVDTYVPWNLHEPRMGEFDFGEGSNDMSMFLNVQNYIKMAQEEDLLVLLRPGPFIGADWEFGGLPSWLQRDPTMKVRTNHAFYMERVKIYFEKLLPLIEELQFSKGGPIIGIQLEDAYAGFNTASPEYLESLYQIFVDHGIASQTLMFTSDEVVHGVKGTLPEKLLYTAKLQTKVAANMKRLKELQPEKPLMVMDYRTGWFSHWLEMPLVTTPGTFVDGANDIMGNWNGSINFYVFHGGSNFGFMASGMPKATTPFFSSGVTSYDFSAPLSEAGDYTVKYRLAQTLIEMYSEPKLKRTEMPAESVKKAYETTQIKEYLAYDDIINQVPSSAKFQMETPVSMENLPMNSDSGQSYGYTVYRKYVDIAGEETVRFQVGPIKDVGIMIVDGIPAQLHIKSQQGQLYRTILVMNDVLTVNLTKSNVTETSNLTHAVDFFIENTGRVSAGSDRNFLQEKGLVNGTYKINGEYATGFEIIALEFKSAWVKSLTDWKEVIVNETRVHAPVLVQTTFEVDEPADTYLDMGRWYKGIVFVNGFNIGRYFRVGPQRTLYIPAPLLIKGSNVITIFEQIRASGHIVFSDKPMYIVPPALNKKPQKILT